MTRTVGLRRPRSLLAERRIVTAGDRTALDLPESGALRVVSVTTG